MPEAVAPFLWRTAPGKWVNFYGNNIANAVRQFDDGNELRLGTDGLVRWPADQGTPGVTLWLEPWHPMVAEIEKELAN